MKRLKRLTALVTAAVLTLGIVGCGGRKQSSADSVFEDDGEFYTIEWYLLNPGIKQKDVEPVQNELNKYLKEKINAEVHMNVFDWSTYSERLNLMLQSGEKMDICWACGNDYYTTVAKKGYVELDGLLEKYAPKLLETIDENLLDGSKVNGKAYGIPANKESASALGVIYRKDIADKLGIDMNNCKTPQDVMEVCKIVKKSYPDMFMTNTSTPNAPVDWLNFDRVYLGYGKWFGDNADTLINLYETPEYKEACEYAYNLRQNGGFYPIGDGKTQNELLDAGQMFCMVTNIKPGKAEEYNIQFNKSDMKYAQVFLGTPQTTTTDCTGSLMCIPLTSENPARTVKFLELLNTDSYVNNLVNFGIEGDGYIKNDDGTVHVLKDAAYKCNGNQWLIGNVFLNYITDEDDPEKNKNFLDFNAQSTASDMLGFSFDVDNVRNEAIAVSNVIKEYSDQLKTGEVSVEKSYDTFMDKMKKAGSDKVLEEVQRQYDEWKKNK